MPASYDHRFLLGPHSPMNMPMQKLLIRNRDRLEEVAAEFPDTEMHRTILGHILKLPIDELSDPAAHHNYVENVLTNSSTRIVIYSYDAFFGSRKSVLSEDFVYPSLEKKIRPLRHLMTGQKSTVFLCLQHYTQFVETELKDAVSFQHLVQSFDEDNDFSWMPFVSRLRRAWPEALIVVVDETDLATHWAVVAALVCGHPKVQDFKNISRYAKYRLATEGRKPYRAALKESPPKTIAEWVSTTTRIFQEFGNYEPIVKRVVTSPWSPEQIELSIANLAADLDALKKLENVVLASDYNLEME